MNYEKMFSPIPPAGTDRFRNIIEFCEENRTEVLSHLSWIAAELANSWGFSATLQFIRDRSGDRIRVPLKGGGWARGLRTETLDRFVLSSDEFGFLVLPSAIGVMDSIRVTAIDIELKRGFSTRSIARRYVVTERGVRKRNAKYFRTSSKQLTQVRATDNPQMFSEIPEIESQDFVKIIKFCENNSQKIIEELSPGAALLVREKGFSGALAFIREHGGGDSAPTPGGVMEKIRRVAITRALHSGASQRSVYRDTGSSIKNLRTRWQSVKAHPLQPLQNPFNVDPIAEA